MCNKCVQQTVEYIVALSFPPSRRNMETYSDLVVNCPEITFKLSLHLTGDGPKGDGAATGGAGAATAGGDGASGATEDASDEVIDGDQDQAPVAITAPPPL